MEITLTYNELKRFFACEFWLTMFCEKFPDGLTLSTDDHAQIIELFKMGFGPVLSWPYENMAEIYRIDLSGADLHLMHMTDITLNGANLKGANLACAQLESASLIRANLDDTNLREANLLNARMDYARFHYANLDAAVLVDARMRGVIMVGTSLKGTVLSCSYMGNCTFESCDFSGADLYHAEIYDTVFKECLYNAETRFPYPGWEPSEEFGWRLASEEDGRGTK